MRLHTYTIGGIFQQGGRISFLKQDVDNKLGPLSLCHYTTAATPPQIMILIVLLGGVGFNRRQAASIISEYS